jgi:hypothetical protein
VQFDPGDKLSRAGCAVSRVRDFLPIALASLQDPSDSGRRITRLRDELLGLMRESLEAL